MTIGVIGKKLGMTQIYDEAGLCIPVTVVAVAAFTKDKLAGINVITITNANIQHATFENIFRFPI